MTPHIEAPAGAVAETVLMPGDPKRARWAAEAFLEDPVQINGIRGMLGFTGTWRGHRVTIHGSGMGMPSLAIYATELIRDYGARRLIRIGSAGAMQPQMALRDIVIAMTASAVSLPSAALLRDLRFAPCADWTLLRNAVAAAEARGQTPAVGAIYSSDCFYDERADLADLLARHGVLAVEMETAELYTLAARLGAKALSLLTISDHLPSGARLPADAREHGFSEMVEIALAAAFPEAAGAP